MEGELNDTDRKTEWRGEECGPGPGLSEAGH